MDYDFVIWVALDWWNRFKPEQKVALVDHELCHCYIDADDKPKILPHDVEEFNCILERHGLWWPNADVTAKAIQYSLLPLDNIRLERIRRGRVEAISAPPADFT